MKEFVKATIIGGLLFLLPVVLVLYFLGTAVGATTEAVQPMADSLGVHRLWVSIFPVLLLVLISLVAGLLARTEVRGRITGWIENSFLGDVPQCQMLRSMAQGHAKVESTNEGTSGVKATLVSIEGG